MSSSKGPIPVTCVTGFLGAGKTTTIIGLLKQLPKDYKVVLLKNEYGDVEVDSLLANQSNITGVSEILNGCLCCTMVGLVENALIEIRDTYKPDRIIIESSGSAFPATLALQIRQLEPQGFRLDGVVTVVDCLNFTGYEDTSPSAKLQAKYTDLLLLSKSQLCTERQLDILHDHLGVLNEDTPRITISPEKPIRPEVVFGLDTKLWSSFESEQEGAYWNTIGQKGGWHGDEVEVCAVWNGPRAKGKEKARGHDHEGPNGRRHETGCECEADEHTEEEEKVVEVSPIGKELLEAELAKLSFEIYRVKGIVRLLSPHSRGWETFILNYAFGRHDLTPMSSLDDEESLTGVGVRLTIMGERGEVARRARRFADAIGAKCE